MILNIPLPGSPSPLINSDNGLIKSDGTGNIIIPLIMDGTNTESIDPNVRQLTDHSTQTSVDWDGRGLIGADGSTAIVDWQNGQLTTNGGNLILDWNTGNIFAIKLNMSLIDASIILGTTIGTKIGTSTSQKLAFHNSTPVIQRAGAAQVAVVTTASTNVTPFGFTTAAQADAIVTLVNEIRAALVQKGLIKGAA